MTQLVRYDEMRHALQQCTRVDEAKEIKDKAEALQAYAKQRKDIEMEAWVAELKIHAIVRIGELSAELEKAELKGRGTVSLPSSGKTKAETLKAAGLSTSVAQRAEQLADPKSRKALLAFIAKKTEQRKPMKFTEALAAVEAAKREQRNRSELHRDALANLSPGLHFGDFREEKNRLENECAELVFTDPPYDRASIPLFGDAAKEAARILKPGGSFIAYCGQIQLPDVLRLCAEHLRYWWVLANIHADGATQMDKYGIKNQWKPMVWFVKGTRGDVQTFVGDTVSGGREKSHHRWQQAESEAAYYIKHLTSPKGRVVDFFAGGGTTLAAAKSLGREGIGFEEDPVAIQRADARVKAA